LSDSPFPECRERLFYMRYILMELICLEFRRLSRFKNILKNPYKEYLRKNAMIY